MIIRLLKLLLSLSCFVLLKLYELLLFFAKMELPSRLVVLYYHDIDERYRYKFRRQMEILKKYAVPVHADFVVPPAPGCLYVAVTFDDGFQNLMKIALEDLQMLDIPCAIFMPAAYMGKPASWIKKPGENRMLLSEEKLKSFSRALVKIGSHAHTHPNLTRVDAGQLEKELTVSKKCLEEIVNYPVDMVAFPYGAYNVVVLEAARACGYARAFSVIPGKLFSKESFLVGRTNVNPDDWLIEFHMKMRGCYCWLLPYSRLKQKVKKNDC